MATCTMAPSDGQEPLRDMAFRVLISFSPWIVAAALLALLFSRNEPGAALFLSGMAIAWLVSAFLAVRQLGATYARRFRPYDKPVTVKVSADSIGIEHQFGSSLLPESFVTRVHRFPRSFAVESATGNTLVILRAALSSAEDAMLSSWAERRP